MSFGINSDMKKILLPCAVILDRAQIKREFITSKNAELMKLVKEVSATMDMVFRYRQNPDKECDVQVVGALLKRAKDIFTEICGKLSKGDLYRYQNMWRVCNQNLITATYFVFFLEKGTLADINHIKETLGSTHYSSENMIKEQCLVGMTHFFHLLVRLGICLGTQGELKRSYTILKFYLDLVNCAKQSFSSEHMRKSYDRLRNEIKTTERTLYELYVRKIPSLDESVLQVIREEKKEYLMQRQNASKFSNDLSQITLCGVYEISASLTQN